MIYNFFRHMKSVYDQLKNPTRKMRGLLNFGCMFHVEHFRGDKKLSHLSGHNLMTTEGLVAIQDILFLAGTQITDWRIAVFENDFTESAAVTYATPTGMTESTAYDEVERPLFQGAAGSGSLVTSEANKATYNFNATKDIYGVALIGGGTTDNGSITAFADATGGQVTVTSAGHGLSNGSPVTISGTTNYNGTYVISNVATDTFEITATWVSDDATGTWNYYPARHKGDTSGGCAILDVYNFGSGQEKPMDAGDTLKVWGEITSYNVVV